MRRHVPWPVWLVAGALCVCGASRVCAEEHVTRTELDALRAEVASIGEDVRTLKDMVALYGPVPVEDEGEWAELEALRRDVDELRAAVAAAAPPLPELPDELLLDDFDVPPEEERDDRWTAVLGVLFLAGVLLVLLWAGSQWGRRRARSGRWEYAELENPTEEQLAQYGAQGWECVGVKPGESGTAAVHSLKRPLAAAGRRGGRWVAALFYLLGVAVLAVAMGNLAMFIDVPSLLIVLVGTALFALAHYPAHEIAAAVHCAVGSAPVEPAAGRAARRVFGTVQSYAMGLGVLGFFIGLVTMLKNMDDPSAIGPGMALALLTVLYAVALTRLVIAPLDAQVARRMDESGGTDPAFVPGSGLWLTVATVVMAVLAFFVLLLSFT